MMTILSSRISGCEYGWTPQCRNKADINVDKTLEEADKKSDTMMMKKIMVPNLVDKAGTRMKRRILDWSIKKRSLSGN